MRLKPTSGVFMKIAFIALTLSLSFAAFATTSSFQESLKSEVQKDLAGSPSCFNGALKASGQFAANNTIVKTQAVESSTSNSYCDTIYDIDMNQSEYAVPAYMGCKQYDYVKNVVTVTTAEGTKGLVFVVDVKTTNDVIVSVNPSDVKHVSETVSSTAVNVEMSCKLIEL
jgi:hypothetical protein